MTPLHQSRERATEIAERLKIFAQPQRLMILSSLLSGERTVGDIEAATSISQPSLSQQLGELRRAKLVATRRAAKQVHYRLANGDVALCVHALVALFGEKNPDEALARILRMESVPSSEKSKNGAAVFATLL